MASGLQDLEMKASKQAKIIYDKMIIMYQRSRSIMQNKKNIGSLLSRGIRRRRVYSTPKQELESQKKALQAEANTAKK